MGGAKVYRGSRAQLVRGQPLGTPSPPPDVFACLDFGVPPCPCLCMKHVYITDMHMHMHMRMHMLHVRCGFSHISSTPRWRVVCTVLHGTHTIGTACQLEMRRRYVYTVGPYFYASVHHSDAQTWMPRRDAARQGAVAADSHAL